MDNGQGSIFEDITTNYSIFFLLYIKVLSHEEARDLTHALPYSKYISCLHNQDRVQRG